MECANYLLTSLILYIFSATLNFNLVSIDLITPILIQFQSKYYIISLQNFLLKKKQSRKYTYIYPVLLYYPIIGNNPIRSATNLPICFPAEACSLAIIIIVPIVEYIITVSSNYISTIHLSKE